jgi:hypothetical protein
MTHVPRNARVSRVYGPEGCRRKFLKFFPGGFGDETYISWEREYKRNAHLRWVETLDAPRMRALMKAGEYDELARRAVIIESRTNLLFSFEKMALRDALRTRDGARSFSEGLYGFLHGRGSDKQKFERWIEAVSELPRRQTRVLTWPLVTVFGFIAQPHRHAARRQPVRLRIRLSIEAELGHLCVSAGVR